MSGNDLTEGRDPAKILKWMLSINDNTVPNYNNNPPTNESESKENIPVTRLADMDEQEKQKWTQIILGQTPDILNNRASLQQAIVKLQEIKGNVKPSSTKPTKKEPTKSKDEDKENTELNEDKDPNEEIKICISIIHNLLDKNEAVLAKLNGVPMLFELMQSSLDVDNEICLDCCTILHDATQNNPMMQNHIYSNNGIPITLKLLQNCKKTNYKIRAKLWALIHVISREHNPNFNIFLAKGGHQEINRVLRIEQSNINDELLKEILRVTRLINYMLGTWSDGNEKVFEILNILKSVNWTIYSLHSYVIRLVSANNMKSGDQNNPIIIMNRMRTAQLILDILMELVGGIRLFMKRNDKCKKFVIANKNNKDITQKLKTLQKDLGDYCSLHRPNLKLEEKTKNGKPYKFKYYTIHNDIDINKNNKAALETIDETKDNDDEDDGDNTDGIYLAMKDIWNTINSILRHVKRYEDHCEQQRKLHEIWKKTTKKGQIYAKKEKLRQQQKASKLTSSTPSSSSPPPNLHQYQMVLYRNKDNENNNDRNDDIEEQKQSQSSSKQNKRNNGKKSSNKKHRKKRKQRK